MSGKITQYFRMHVASQFYEQFNEDDPSVIYFFIARPQSWSDDTNPPSVTDSVTNTSYAIWDNMMSLKRIEPSDVSFAIPNNKWTTGKVYDEYSSETEFFSGANGFFVVTDDYQVYKCLYNNNGANSTVKPVGQSTSNLQTNDGYIWKYMYSISAADALKFAATDYVPVKSLTVDDGSSQWDVQASAANGAINTILIDSVGSGYHEATGTIITGGSTNCTLAVTASANNGFYTGSTIYISSGTGSGQLREITAYNGSTKIATVNTAFSPSVDTTSVYVVSPKVAISGDGTGAKAYSRVTGGEISRINVINSGNNYVTATATITANSGFGATVTPQISPVGGHGKDAVSELFAHDIIMNVKLTGNESNTFMVSNDFRIVGLIANPLTSTGNTAVSTTYNQTTRLTVANTAGTFSKDEIITGSTSNTNGIFVEYMSNNVLMITGNVKDFSNNEIITGGTSSASAKIVGITKPDLKKYSGKVIYIENRNPVIRDVSQQEDIKIIVKM